MYNKNTIKSWTWKGCYAKGRGPAWAHGALQAPPLAGTAAPGQFPPLRALRLSLASAPSHTHHVPKVLLQTSRLSLTRAPPFRAVSPHRPGGASPLGKRCRPWALRLSIACRHPLARGLTPGFALGAGPLHRLPLSEMLNWFDFFFAEIAFWPPAQKPVGHDLTAVSYGQNSGPKFLWEEKLKSAAPTASQRFGSLMRHDRGFTYTLSHVTLGSKYCRLHLQIIKLSWESSRNFLRVT